MTASAPDTAAPGGSHLAPASGPSCAPPPCAAAAVPAAASCAPLAAVAVAPALPAAPRRRLTPEGRETRFLRRADSLAASGRVDRAVAHLHRLVAAFPASTRGQIRLAFLLHNENRLGEALEVLRDAIVRAPRSLAAREMQAEFCLEAGLWEQAVAACGEILVLAPRSLIARDVLAAAYLQRGLLEKALRLTDEMIRLDPADGGNHFKRGVLLQQMGRVGAAVLAFSRVLEMGGPDHETIGEARAALDMLDNYQMRQIITLAVEDVSFRILLGRDAAEAVGIKGYVLSPFGLQALAQMRFDDLPQSAPPGWRQLCYQ